MSEMHHHPCPECHELPACLADCAIEPDLGLTPGGYPKAHHVVCMACERRNITPSEIALAKMLAAWDEWPGWEGDGDDIDEIGDTVARLGNVLADRGMVTNERDVSAAGRALLDRARKAGLL